MEFDKRINFQEVIYSSTQKGIMSNAPGFGVRTYSQGISNNLVDVLIENDFFGYELPMNRMVDLDQLESNPRIVYDYPENFIYRKITFENKTKYIFSRTIYIGIDYGYFCGVDHCRTGSNYFSHLIIFDEEPSPEIFRITINNNYFENKVFLPLDYTCSPQNKELSELLTGNPQILPANSFYLRKRNIDEFDLRFNVLIVLIGVLQFHIHKKNSYSEENKKALIIKADKDISKLIIDFIKNFIPQAISLDLTFITNYRKNGIPPHFDIVFVNEFYEGNLYEDDHFCIDLFNNKGISEQNFLFHKIEDLLNLGDLDTLKLLLEYISGVDFSENQDLELIYNIFILTKTDSETILFEDSYNFIGRLAHLNLLDWQKQIIYMKVNNAINKKLMSINELEIYDGLLLISRLRDANLIDVLTIENSSKESFSRLLFDSNMYFGKVVSSENINIVLDLVVPNIIRNTNRLFASLHSTDAPIVWKLFIEKCFFSQEKLNANVDLIISEIIKSQIPIEYQNNLLLELYPIVEDETILLVFNFFVKYPFFIDKHIDVLLAICNRNPEVFYPELILNTLSNQSVLEVVISGFLELYRTNIEAIDAFFFIVKSLPEEVLKMFNINDLIQEFISHVFKLPSEGCAKTIDSFLNSSFKIKLADQNRLKSLRSILDGEMPILINVDTLYFAIQLARKNILNNMFNEWIKEGFTQNELLMLIQRCQGLKNHPDFIAYMLTTIWNYSSAEIQLNKKKFVETIINSVSWSQDEYKNFIQSTASKELVSYVLKLSNLFRKLLKKIFR